MLDKKKLLGLLGSCCVVLAGGCAAIDKMISQHKESDKEAGLHADEAKPSPGPKIKSETYWAAGRMLEEQGDAKGAIAQYEKAIAADQRYIAAYNQLGVIYQRLARWSDAEQIIKRGLQQDPQSAVLWNNLGCCYLSQQRWSDAEKNFRQALTISPTFQRARMNRGIALALMGKEEKSLDEFSLVVSPDTARYNLALIMVTRRDYAGAERMLNEALTINPNCPGAKEQIARIRRLAAASEKSSPVSKEVVPVPVKPEPSPLAGGLDEDPRMSEP